MSKELKTGFIAVAIIVAFIWGFNFLKGEDIFKPNVRKFKVEYKNVGGLNEASIVTINGLKVGQVNDITFNKTPEKRGMLIVEFTVDSDFEFSKNSIVKIYSPNPLSGSSLAIIPDYKGEMAKSGDFLPGEMEQGLFTSIGERLDPLQHKIENVLEKADTLFAGINKILNDETITGINNSVQNLSGIITDLRTTINNVNDLVQDNKSNLKETLENTKNITTNLSKVSDTLTTVNINNIVKKAENAVDNFNQLSERLNSNDGSLGKLMNDKKLYDNMAAATKELEQLLRDLKLNPKRYVHFSLFGKKPKPYQPAKPDSLLIKQ